MDKQEENMSNTNDTIESKQKSEMTKKVRVRGKNRGTKKDYYYWNLSIIISHYLFNWKFLFQ